MDKSKLLISSKLKNVFVTSVKFFDSCIFIGRSGTIHVFELLKSKLHKYEEILSVEVFHSQNIYGIVPNYQNDVLVFGGKLISVLKWNSENSKKISIQSSGKAEDWILDGIWCVENDNVILLTAHNVILQYKISPTCKLIGKLVSTERCILYSGKIFGSTLEDVVVIAGTVYQEVIIWTAPEDKKDVNIPVVQRLEGHKGVIFCTTYDEKSQCIASTSDDRTVRVWLVEFPEEFSSVSAKWTFAKIYLSFTAFGHTARVWRCIFTSSGDLTTVGEDCNICLWNKKGDILNRWEHSGEIWCVDHHNDCIAVGGNGVTIRSLIDAPKVEHYNINNLGCPRKAVLSLHGNPIISSDKGYLIQLENDNCSFSVYDEKFISYCVISVSPCRTYVILGGIHGDIVLYKVKEKEFCKLDETNSKEGRIYSLIWISSISFAICGDNGCLSIYKVVSQNEQYSLMITHQYILPQSKERWITCGLITENFFVCGDRMGSLHLYSLSSKCKEPISSFLKLHDLKGVTDIKNFNELLLTVGRDGSLRELEILDNSLHLNSTLKLPMNWATCIINTQLYGLLIAGFHEANFVLWSIDERITLMTLKCGGGHRSFDFFIDESNKNLVLTYIRMKEINFICTPIENHAHSTLIKSYHRKSINSSCLLNYFGDKVSVLTGGEDNSLRLSKFNDKSWQSCGTYVRHISAIRVVKSFENIAVSAGGRAQIIVWEVNGNEHGDLQLKELKSHMIREETAHRKSWKDAQPLIDPEIRYMDLEINKNEDGTFTIFTACSDGMLRIFECDTDLRSLGLRISINAGQGCLLKLSKFYWNKVIGLVSCGTKGTVKFWYPSFQKTENSTHTIHSMGINAMDLLIAGDNIVLATGGDDTSVIFTLFNLSPSKPETVVFSIIEHAHTCQVTGIKITPEIVISASVDQKVCLFSWKLEGNFLKTFFIAHYLTSVPDIHGILSWKESSHEEKSYYILAFGCGFQLLHLKSP